jgi:hypothetical protein
VSGAGDDGSWAPAGEGQRRPAMGVFLENMVEKSIPDATLFFSSMRATPARRPAHPPVPTSRASMKKLRLHAPPDRRLPPRAIHSLHMANRQPTYGPKQKRSRVGHIFSTYTADIPISSAYHWYIIDQYGHQSMY